MMAEYSVEDAIPSYNHLVFLQNGHSSMLGRRIWPPKKRRQEGQEGRGKREEAEHHDEQETAAQYCVCVKYLSNSALILL